MLRIIAGEAESPRLTRFWRHDAREGAITVRVQVENVAGASGAGGLHIGVCVKVLGLHNDLAATPRVRRAVDLKRLAQVQVQVGRLHVHFCLAKKIIFLWQHFIAYG